MKLVCKTFGPKSKDRKDLLISTTPNSFTKEIPELPQEPKGLRIAYDEAVKCLDNGCPVAAVIMFRRALQIITRDILGAAPGNLADELRSLKNKDNKLGIKLSSDFHEYSCIIKDVGNQRAHPDKDKELLDISMKDAFDIYSIFIDIVSGLFIIPAQKAAIKEGLIQRRKLSR